MYFWSNVWGLSYTYPCWQQARISGFEANLTGDYFFPISPVNCESSLTYHTAVSAIKMVMKIFLSARNLGGLCHHDSRLFKMNRNMLVFTSSKDCLKDSVSLDLYFHGCYESKLLVFFLSICNIFLLNIIISIIRVFFKIKISLIFTVLW